MKIIFLILILFPISILASDSCAVVSLFYKSNQYDEDFILGALTLGQSLRMTNTSMKMVMLATHNILPSEIELLNSVGWEVRLIDSIRNPNSKFVPRFDQIYTKLTIFNLIDFKKVVYLDSDIIVTSNIDHMCKCNAVWCGVVRNPFVNAGVLVVTPSADRFKGLIARIASTPSYTSGDQGFFNSVFWNPEECPYLDTRIDKEIPYNKCYRLPVEFNGDVALYVARNNKWTFDPTSTTKIPPVIHYTMGYIKPWVWWSYMIIPENWRWWDIYSTIEDTTYKWMQLIIIFTPAFLIIFMKRYYVEITIPLPKWAKLIFFYLMEFSCIAIAYSISCASFFMPYINAVIFITYYLILSSTNMKYFKNTRMLQYDLISFGLVVVFFQIMFIEMISIYTKCTIAALFSFFFIGVYKTTLFNSI